MAYRVGAGKGLTAGHGYVLVTEHPDDEPRSMFILNRDMRKQNADTLQIVEEFADLAADTNIEFRLAQLDPNGNCTNGIVRLASPLTYQGNYDMKLLSNWSVRARKSKCSSSGMSPILR